MAAQIDITITQRPNGRWVASNDPDGHEYHNQGNAQRGAMTVLGLDWSKSKRNAKNSRILRTGPRHYTVVRFTVNKDPQAGETAPGKRLGRRRPTPARLAAARERAADGAPNVPGREADGTEGAPVGEPSNP